MTIESFVPDGQDMVPYTYYRESEEFTSYFSEALKNYECKEAHSGYADVPIFVRKNYSAASSSEDYRIPAIIVMPMAAGKSHLGKNFGEFLDVDLIKLPSAIIDMREKAHKTGDFTEHNAAWYSYVGDRLSSGFKQLCLLCHSLDMALALKPLVIAIARPNKPLFDSYLEKKGWYDGELRNWAIKNWTDTRFAYNYTDSEHVLGLFNYMRYHCSLRMEGTQWCDFSSVTLSYTHGCYWQWKSAIVIPIQEWFVMDVDSWCTLMNVPKKRTVPAIKIGSGGKGLRKIIFCYLPTGYSCLSKYESTESTSWDIDQINSNLEDTDEDMRFVSGNCVVNHMGDQYLVGMNGLPVNEWLTDSVNEISVGTGENVLRDQHFEYSSSARLGQQAMAKGAVMDHLIYLKLTNARYEPHTMDCDAYKK